MRYEKIEFDCELKEHPYVLLRGIIEDAHRMACGLRDILFIEGGVSEVSGGVDQQEVKHKELFNIIWNKYNEEEFNEYIDLYINRIKVNSLESDVSGKECVDLGCGNGVFCFAMIRMGARRVVGIDFGEESIRFARHWAERMGVADRCEFRVASVYETEASDSEFDFAVQNGVFHHLDDQEAALAEARRIVKIGGGFWYYVDGAGAIESELFDVAVRVLNRIPSQALHGFFEALNMGVGKKTYLTDVFKATYARTTLAALTEQLGRHGFDVERRLTGGSPFDFDHDRIAADPYGVEKFGEGILRVLGRRSA